MKNKLNQNELMIGNIINDTINGVIKVHRVLENRIRYIDKKTGKAMHTSINQCEGIPIKGDVIPPFDFAQNFSCYVHDGIVDIEQYGEGLEELSHVKYIHQLQNLYFALKGVSLDIVPYFNNGAIKNVDGKTLRNDDKTK